MVDEWLRSKGTVLWGTFDVSAEDTRAKAVDWFIAEQDSFDAFLYEKVKDRDRQRIKGVLDAIHNPRLGAREQATLNPGNPVVRVTATSGGPQIRGEILPRRFEGYGPYSREDKFTPDYDVVTGDEGHLIKGSE